MVVMLIGLGLFGLSRIGDPVRIDTDLKNLSPALSDDLELQGAVNAISRSLESRMVLLVAADAGMDTSAAAANLAQQLSRTPGVSASIGDAIAPKLIDLYATHRFNLLSPRQRVDLETRSDEQLTAAATSRLFQLADNSRILPFEQDPLGWFTDYVGALASSANQARDTAQSDDAVTTVNVNLGEASLDGEFQKLFSTNLSEGIADVSQKFPEITIYKSGIFLFAEQAARTARSDIKLISTVSTFAVIFLILLAFRSLRPMLLALVSIVIGISFAFAASHVLYGKVHILTLVFGVGLIGIVIDYALHYSYHQTWVKKSDNRWLTSNPQSILLSAMALSLGSSLVGYGALGLSPLPALGRVAVFSCLGLAASWVSVIALGPTLGRGNPDHHSKVLEKATDLIAGLTRRIASAGWLLIALFAVCVYALLVTGVTSNDNPRALFEPDPALVEQERAVAARSRQLQPGQYFIVRGASVDALYASIELLQQAAPPGRLLSINNLLPSPRRQRDDYQRQARLYEAGGVVDGLLKDIGAGPEIGKQLAMEYAARRGQVVDPRRFAEAAGKQLPPLVLEQDGKLFAFVLIRDLDGLEPAFAVAEASADIQFIDTAGMTSRALGNQRRSALRLLLLGFALVGGLLLWRYRRLAALGMLMVPASSMLIVLVTFSLLGIGLTLFHTMALFLVLGLGMDYVIFSAELREHQSITTQAVFLSALTSLLSFGLLAWSSMPVVQAFGITMLIGNLSNLLGALVYSSLITRHSMLDISRTSH